MAIISYSADMNKGKERMRYRIVHLHKKVASEFHSKN
jgi:hypothetical protein